MKSNSLNVLYQSSDYYSMMTAVSIASLCRNNQIIPTINIFLLDDGIDQKNLVRIKEICSQYQRNLILIEADIIRERTEKTRLPARHGSRAIFYKWFAIDLLNEQEVDRILYLDSDTIVDKSIEDLMQFELDEDHPMALPHCFHLNWQKERMGLSDTSSYFTPGVMLVEVPQYKSKGYLSRFLSHQDERYGVCDEEIVNIEFGDEIKALPLQYNFYPNFYEYGVDNMYRIYDLDSSFESKDEIKNIMDEGPRILHCLELMTGRPWEKGNGHPYNEKFDGYLKLTEWTEDDKFEVGRNRFHDMQKLAFKILPSSLYCKLHRMMYKRHMREPDRQAVEGVIY